MLKNCDLYLPAGKLQISSMPSSLNSSLYSLPYSPIFLKSCVVLLLGIIMSGCASSGPTELEKIAATESHVLQLRTDYVELNHPFINQYFSDIRARLATRSKLRQGPTLVFASNRRFAYSAGNGVIVLSTQLIRSLSNEAELAFVIAHELAHDKLKHSERADEAEVALEKEADSYATGAIALAGYDPRAALSALSNTHRFGVSEAPTHPKLEERLAKIHKEIRDSGWTPPGTLHKRDFHKLKQAIS